jgi:hypothetical protein
MEQRVYELESRNIYNATKMYDKCLELSTKIGNNRHCYERLTLDVDLPTLIAWQFDILCRLFKHNHLPQEHWHLRLDEINFNKLPLPKVIRKVAPNETLEVFSLKRFYSYNVQPLPSIYVFLDKRYLPLDIDDFETSSLMELAKFFNEILTMIKNEHRHG